MAKERDCRTRLLLPYRLILPYIHVSPFRRINRLLQYIIIQAHSRLLSDTLIYA